MTAQIIGFPDGRKSASKRPAADPRTILIEAVQSAYRTMPEDSQKKAGEVYLAMLEAGVKKIREEGGL
jgi:hypothetical protein